MRPLTISPHLLLILLLAGCGGGGGGGNPAPAPTAARTDPTATLHVDLVDVNQVPIADAQVAITTAGSTQQSRTGADGTATFTDLRVGESTLTVNADGFEPAESTLLIARGTQRQLLTMEARDAWSVGRAVVLGTHVVDRAVDGSTLTYSIDVAVIDTDSDALTTLTSDQFANPGYDCGWGGPRDCASDAQGNSTGAIYPDGDAEAFEFMPASESHPYIVSVLAERSNDITDWNQRGPALKSFFASLDGNGVAQLSSVQTRSGSTGLAVLGPFTSDGASYLQAIDSLSAPAAEAPAMLDALMESMRRAALADDGGVSGAERTVLVMARQGLTPSEIDTVKTLSAVSGVHVSTVFTSTSSWYGFSEASMRTGGFVADFQDPRQLAMIFGAMDSLLSGTPPHYRMQFRLKGAPRTFVSGGNAKTMLHVNVPAAIPNRGVFAGIDVAIP